MRRARRNFINLILIILVIAAIPLGVGYFFKQNYIKFIQAQYQGRVVIQEYHMGWFSSDVTLFYQFPTVEAAAGSPLKSAIPSGVTVEQHILHGPYPIDPSTNLRVFVEAIVLSTVHLDPHTENYLHVPADTGLMQAHTIVTFGNVYTSDVSMSPLSIKDSTITANWQGLSGTQEFTVEHDTLNHMTGNLVAGALNLQDSANSSFSLSGAKISYDLTCELNKICIGKNSLQIPALLGVNHLGQAAKVTGISLNIENSLNNDKFDNTMQISIKDLEAPSFNVGAASFEAAYKNLNFDALNDLIEKLKADTSNSSDVQTQRLSMVADLNTGLIKVLTPQSTMSNDLKVATSNGNITSNMRLSWPSNEPLPASTLELPSKVHFTMNLRVAAQLVDLVIKTLDDKAAAEKALVTSQMPDAPIISPTMDFEASLPEFVTFQSLVNSMVVSKQITPQVQANIFNMVKLHKYPQEVSDFVGNLVRSRQMLVPAARQLEQAYAIFYAADIKNILHQVFSATTPNLRTLKLKIEALGQINIISKTTASELIDLQNQSLAPEIYKLALHRFVINNVITQDFEAYLDANYGYINKDLSLNADAGITTGLPGGAASGYQSNLDAPGATIAQTAPVGQLQSEFDTLVKQGYVVKNGEDFIVSVEFTNNTLKVNGVPFTSQNYIDMEKSVP
jgi:uncharacterized protein YdgA (DUF945 family)